MFVGRWGGVSAGPQPTDRQIWQTVEGGLRANALAGLRMLACGARFLSTGWVVLDWADGQAPGVVAGRDRGGAECGSAEGTAGSRAGCESGGAS